MVSKGKITLKSSNGEVFEVDEAVALLLQAINYITEDEHLDGNIILSNVTGRILAKVIEYYKKHVEAINFDDKPSEEDLKAWYVDFMKVDEDMLFDLIMGF
ncbi:S-phase kinase-associated protein 1-like [Sesbania bispinosa]|nr:S-phase kinase-associated protein 1-like [Sesbania bispinosa]